MNGHKIKSKENFKLIWNRAGSGIWDAWYQGGIISMKETGPANLFLFSYGGHAEEFILADLTPATIDPLITQVRAGNIKINKSAA